MAFRIALAFAIAASACGGGHAHDDGAACTPPSTHALCGVQVGSACCTDSDCCSGLCVDHACAALTPSCSSLGELCGRSSDKPCCSGDCPPLNPDDSLGHSTCSTTSWCKQIGDRCSSDAECCRGRCDLVPGHAAGACAMPSVAGPSCRAGVAGEPCRSCGACCSGVCQPPTVNHYQEPGMCEPAGGCRVDGDTCGSDADCCGAAGTALPGAGNVRCLKERPTDYVGFCGGAGCVPEGGNCQGAGLTCGSATAPLTCCNGGTCTPDASGVLRCQGLGSACRSAGESCADSGDCCNQAPCHDQLGSGFTCGSACVPSLGTCTTDAECCSHRCTFGGGPTGRC